MQYEINPILLSSMAMIQYVSCAPSVTGKEHRKIEPKAKHFSHGKNYQSSWPNQTDKRIQRRFKYYS